MANARRIAAARAALVQAFGGGWRHSRIWRTPAWPPGLGPDFANAVSILPRSLPPRAVLARLHAIEARAGRIRGRRWAARTLDLDLLAVGAMVRPDRAAVRGWMGLDAAAQRAATPDGLILPHPRLRDRAFVLAPLVDLLPHWRHPITGRRADAMLAALPRETRKSILPLGPYGLASGRRRA